MKIPEVATLQRINVELENRLMAYGFERGVLCHLTDGRGNLSQRIKNMPDSDWESSDVFSENMIDLAKWAAERLLKKGVKPKSVIREAKNSDFGSTTLALGFALASSSEIQAKTQEIRRRFWNSEIPFPANSLGWESAVTQAGDWLERMREEDTKQSPKFRFVGLDLVLQTDDMQIDLDDILEDIVLPSAISQPNGTLIGGEMSMTDLALALQKDFAGKSVSISHRTIRSCGKDGKSQQFLELSGADGWRKIWPTIDGGLLDELREECRKLADLSKKWNPLETLDYLMLGVVPSLSPQYTWDNIRDPYSTLTLAFRAPVTRDDVIQAYESATSGALGGPVKARRLSKRHQAVMQLVHDMPNATWGERLERYEQWRMHYPELPSYGGVTAQQAMRRDWERASERAGWVEQPRTPAKNNGPGSA